MTSVTMDRRFGVNGNLAWKAPVRCATTANITLSGLQSIDGVTTVADDRVLVKNQTSAVDNGIWLASTGAWSRAVDANGNRDLVEGTSVLVTDGSTQDGTYWRITTANPITVGTSSITWAPALVQGISSLSFLQAGTGAILRNAQDKMREVLNVDDFGAIGDGTSHPLSETYATLAAAQAVYPAAIALTDEKDWCAIQQCVTTATSKVAQISPGKTYMVNRTITPTLVRGLIGAGTIKWNGTAAFNGPLIDISGNSGAYIGGYGGEMTLRCDTPSTCRYGIKMGGGATSTFQSVVEDVGLFGSAGGASPTIAVDGGSSAGTALNDGEFRRVRVEGWDDGYQFSAPDNKLWGGTIRVETSGTNGRGINIANNARVECYGTVFSENRYAIRCAHGVWGAAFYGCWFEGSVVGIVEIDATPSDILQGLSFHNCQFSADTPATYLFDLNNWRPGTILNQGHFQLIGGGISSTSFTAAIRLHSDGTKQPLSVQLVGFNDAANAIAWSGTVSSVIRLGPHALYVGNTSGGIARHFTHLETSLAWASIAGHDRDVRTATITGVRTADNASVLVTPSALPANGLIYQARISADNTAQLCITNTTTGAQTPATMDWRFDIFTH